MKVLIIEDDADLAAAMADYLELQGAECDFAYQGISGLRLALEGSFDIVILDLMLPRMGGFEVCEQLRQQSVFTPNLMLTACDTNADQLTGFQAGLMTMSSSLAKCRYFGRVCKLYIDAMHRRQRNSQWAI